MAKIKCPECNGNGGHVSSGDGWEEWDDCRCCNKDGNGPGGTVSTRRLAEFRREEAAKGTAVTLNDRLIELARGEREVAAGMDADPRHTANGQYAQTADDARARIADLEHQLWLLLGDVKARAVSCTCVPPLTRDEQYHIDRADALLAWYEPQE